jgi:phosphoribosylglycinamide formyltransferase 1
MNIVFLSSGGGGHLKFVYEMINQSDLTLKNMLRVKAVIADRECGALEYAKANNINSCLHSFKRNSEQNAVLINLLKDNEADIIITNVHKIIDEEVLLNFEGKMINLHYSILPSFQGSIGMKTVENAIEHGCRFLGASVHYVTNVVDAGKVISQSVFPFFSQPNVYDIVFKSGCLSLWSALLLQLRIVPESYSSYKEIITNPSYGTSAKSLDVVFKKIEA